MGFNPFKKGDNRDQKAVKELLTKEQEKKQVLFNWSRMQHVIRAMELGLEEQASLQVTDQGIIPQIAVRPVEPERQEVILHRMKRQQMDMYVMSVKPLGVIDEAMEKEIADEAKEDAAIEKSTETGVQ